MSSASPTEPRPAAASGVHGGEPPRARWSLTRRMALIFALTTSAIIALYGAWSGYLLSTALRVELAELMDHESREVVQDLERSGGSDEAVREITEEVHEIFVKPACAYRVRRGSGEVVAAFGLPRLLDGEVAVLLPDQPPDLIHLLGKRPLSTTRPVQGHDLEVELLVDVLPTRATLFRFLRSAIMAFLGALVLAAVAGWYTAWRGLAGLRALVSHARSIDLQSVQAPGAGPRLPLDGAPEELRQLGAEIEAMLARIDTGLGQMRTFTAGLAHELRSPLQNLIGETEVTLLSERSGDDYRALLRSNLEDLTDLSDAIDNLITWCRTNDPARQQAPHESFDLAAEARLRLERERRSALRDGVRFEFTTDGDTVVVADREACLRVLRNLVANAIAWSPPGSSVSVHLSGRPDGVRLVVDDQGPGIPQELGERVFEPFVSGRQHRGRRGGYGLGLAICLSIMREHGGSLRFERREEGGTRFLAEFPRRAPVVEAGNGGLAGHAGPGAPAVSARPAPARPPARF